MGPRTLQPSALTLVVVPAVVSTIIVCIRVWRRNVTKKFAIEDVLLIIAQILIVVLTITTWKSYKISWYGYHYWDIPPGAVNRTEYQKWGFANAVVYNPILGLIKASFVITLLKLRSPNRRINICLWTIFTINGVFTIAAPLVCAFQCSPVSKFWDRAKPGTCIDSAKYTYGTIGIVLITDVAVVIMPTWILRNLHMPFRRKAMYIAFLSFGLAVTGIGGYRLYVFVQLFTKKANNPDASYGMRQGLSNVEVSLASIGACGATVKWLLGQCIPFFRDDDTPRLSKYNASRSSGANGDPAGRPARSATWSWRSWERRTAGTENTTVLSQETEVAAPPPPVVWKRVETRMRGKAGRKPAGQGAEGQPATGSRVEEEQRRVGTSTTNASSSREVRPRDVLT